VILDHYKNPHGRGLREPYEAEVHHVNPTCGDELTLRVHLEPGAGGEAPTVRDISYDGQGCSISQSATSVLYEMLVGTRLDEAMRVVDGFHEMVSSRGTVEGDEDLLGDGIAFAGVSRYPARVKCALLGWMAFKDAVARTAYGDVAGDDAADAAGDADGRPARPGPGN